MAYVISELNLERQKLLAKVLAPVTDRLLSVLQLPSGARGLDLGCGMGETTRQLARTLDKPNEIIGLELNPDLVERAKKLSSGEQDDVSFEQGDVSALEFADNSFDFVFARYLLMHLAEPEAVLKEMLRVCKSGGAVAVQEPDFSFQRCYPDSWAYERLPDLFRRLFPDAFLGPKLWSLFQKLGYSSSNVLIDCMVEVNQNDLRRCYRLSVEAMEKAMIEKGICSEPEFERLRAELERVEKEENILCVSNYIFSAWVVKGKVAALGTVSLLPRGASYGTPTYSMVDTQPRTPTGFAELICDNFPITSRAQKTMLGLDFVLARCARNASETGACSWGDGHANRANREPPHHSLRKRRNQVSEIGDFVFGAVGSFTNDSTPFAARLCSVQAGRSVSLSLQ